MGELKIGDLVCYSRHYSRHGTVERIDKGPKSFYRRIWVQWKDNSPGDLRDYWEYDLELVQ